MKRGWIFASVFIVFLLFVSGVYAQTNTSTGSGTTTGGVTPSGTVTNANAAVDKAYQCLKDQIDDRPGISLEEAIFGALALGSYGNVSAVIDSSKSTSENCWPKNGCKIKETAQVAMAYQAMGKSTESIKAWLLSKSKNAVDLAWHLEIDTENQKASQCTITYDGRGYNINVDENQKITGNTGPCLSISASGYLLKIRESCLDKTYDISCKESFVTTLLYQKDTGNGQDCLDQNNATCFVLPDTHSASSLGTTSEKVDSTCFGTGNSCDYEGTLWATIALQKLNAKENITKNLPYLSALSEDYRRYMPESFLLGLTSSDDYYSSLISNRKQAGYWETDNSPYNRFYDTSVGMLGLGSSSSKSEIQITQDYLLGIQTKDGCWNNNNVRDTAFILYSGWARAGVRGSGGGSSAFCQEAGFSCERLSDCTAASGNVLENFECTGVGICCSVKVSKPSCTSQGGNVCSLSQECNGRNVESSEGACCVGTCVAIETNTCEVSPDATCRNSCQDGEVATSDSCGTGGNVCCVAVSSSGSSLWIWILVILIILILLAIFFRHKLRIWFFSLKGKIKSEPAKKSGESKGSGSPAPPRMMPGPRFGPPPRSMPPQRMNARPVRGTDREMEETLKKLREMSK